MFQVLAHADFSTIGHLPAGKLSADYRSDGSAEGAETLTAS